MLHVVLTALFLSPSSNPPLFCLVLGFTKGNCPKTQHVLRISRAFLHRWPNSKDKCSFALVVICRPTQKQQNLNHYLYHCLSSPLKISLYVPIKWLSLLFSSAIYPPCVFWLTVPIFCCWLTLMFRPRCSYSLWLPHEQTFLSSMWNLVSTLAVYKFTLQHTSKKDNQQLQPTRILCITIHC